MLKLHGNFGQSHCPGMRKTCETSGVWETQGGMEGIERKSGIDGARKKRRESEREKKRRDSERAKKG